MATFYQDFPYALHVVPLHAWKSIVASRTLLSKDDRQREGIRIERSSSAAVDRALGFTKHVHCYLSREGTANTADGISILRSKLLRTSPFPHIVLRISTRALPDEDCTVCCWNIAKSQPKAGALNGGLWLGHATPDDILAHWNVFRKSKPPVHKARGYWEQGLHVPVLNKIHFKTDAALLRTNGQELLLRSPFALPADTQVWSFSGWDSRSLRVLKSSASFGLSQFAKTLPGYSDCKVDPVDPRIRVAIERYFGDPIAKMPSLEFD